MINRYTTKLTPLDVPNNFGKTYKSDVMSKVIEAFKQTIQAGVVYGQYGVPEMAVNSIESDVASHKVMELWITDNCLYGAFEFLGNSRGDKLLKDMRDGMLIDWKLRGRGKTEKNIVLDFTLTTIYAVKRGNTF